MVPYPAILASNSRIPTALPPGLVAVFVGATSGIGEYTLRALAKHAKAPRIYFVGRSQEAGDRIAAECKALNPDGEFIFMKSDVSLMRNVDTVCQEIKRKEKAINLVCLSQGTLYNTDGNSPASNAQHNNKRQRLIEQSTVTDEGLRTPIALTYYSRMRFLTNLSPLLQTAPGLRRVLSIFAGGKEGPVDLSNLRLDHGSNPLALRGQMAAMMTFGLETLAARAPTVGFVHSYPGPVRSGIARDRNWVTFVLRNLFLVLGPFIYVPEEESGERHCFVATSGMFAAAGGGKGGEGAGVGLGEGGVVAKGADGRLGSGVYTTDSKCEASGEKVDAVLEKMRKEGVPQKVWEHTEAEFVRMVGTASM
ncbi:hypothetical protein LTR02_002475 [Friedmanniomyces endolithicus]|nr:hypothetical protein LTR94_009474 [Friedmanniomyces endolithicus]KAK0798447.1 hypothetical protein LTR59_006452 [Friedmanniomyces endolithicus]KAK0804371.1 hypothetical protein LTR75_007686 [Friedmanniomyces endolithicus]KAK0811303.1 hypothetical protein LTR38_003631 [Friedmanniomyces endolithicus]KAK0872021.1 hypothetical protein LTS02_001515 [Friedmanniomyces endolithicus]